MIFFQRGKIPHFLHLFSLFLSRITKSLSKSLPCPSIFPQPGIRPLTLGAPVPSVVSVAPSACQPWGSHGHAGPSWTAWGLLVSPDSFMVQKEWEAERDSSLVPLPLTSSSVCVADCPPPPASLGEFPIVSYLCFSGEDSGPCLRPKIHTKPLSPPPTLPSLP